MKLKVSGFAGKLGFCAFAAGVENCNRTIFSERLVSSSSVVMIIGERNLSRSLGKPANTFSSVSDLEGTPLPFSLSLS